MQLFKFALSRYAYFLSYLAAFLAGVAIVVPAIYMIIPLIAAAVLGSASAYYRWISSGKDNRERQRLDCVSDCRSSGAADGCASDGG